MRQNRAQLRFANHTQRFRTGHHTSQLVNTACKTLYGIQAGCHLLQPLRHDRKRRFQPLIYRRIELFIHRLPHLFQLLTVILVDFLQTTLNRLPHTLQACFIAAQLFF